MKRSLPLWLAVTLAGCGAPPVAPMQPLSDAGAPPDEARAAVDAAADSGPPDLGPRCTGALGPGPASFDGGALDGGFTRFDALEQILSQQDTTPYADYAQTSSVVAADLDGDGLVDLLDNHVGAGTWIVHQGPAGTFTNIGSTAAHRDGSPSTCLLAADLDGDGFIDVHCLYPHAVAWGTATGPDWANATVIAPSSGPTEMAELAWDVDEDGLLDLIDAPFGPAKTFWRNRGNRTFEDESKAWGLPIPGDTWAVSFLDLDGDGRMDLYVANDGSGKENYAFRALGPGSDGEPRFQQIDPLAPTCDPFGLFTFGDANPMGLAIGDLDGDGRFELYLADASPGHVLSQQSDGSWIDVTKGVNLGMPVTTSGAFMVPWSPFFWDADHDGLLDLIVPGGDDAGFHQMPGRGNELSPTLFYHGVANSRFEEIHSRVGLTSFGQYQNLTPVDLDGDGDLDLILGGWSQPAQVYLNQLTTRATHLLLTLRGHTSNPLGLGAIVTATAGPLKRTHQFGDHFGPRVMALPVLDIALGAATQLDELHVLWPSGYEQVVHSLPAGGHQLVEEPELIAIDPPSRHVPADGHSTVTIVVRPVDSAGNPLSDKVTITSPFQPVSWQSPEQPRTDGSTIRTLTAPTTPGTAVIQVTAGTTPYKIRPRLWFD